MACMAHYATLNKVALEALRSAKEWKDGDELLEEPLPKIEAYYEVKAVDEIKRKIEMGRR